MSKYTNSKLQKKAVLSWQQDVEKFVVYPQSWGFFQVNQWDYTSVNRPFWILYWNPVPGFWMKYDDVGFEPDPEKVYLFPPHTRFIGKINKPFIQFAVHFLAEAPFDRVQNKMLVFPAGNIPKLIMKLSDSNSKLRNTILLQQIILNVLSQIPMEAFSPQQKSLIDPRIKEILRYIKENPGERHTVESLSKKVQMSVNNFHRKFVAGTDTTPKKFLLKVHMEYAKKMLLETEMTIDEIAAAAGFLDRYHFSKVFKSFFLFSPVTFKKKTLREPKAESTS